jgi:hypothetical protein
MKAKALRKYLGEFVVIEWEDANGNMAWLDVADAANSKLLVIESVGRLIAVADDRVVMATDRNTTNGQVNGVGVVPIEHIVGVHRLTMTE